VARAKRTNRAEARRRYRAQLAAQSNGDAVDTPDRAVEPAPRAARPVSEPPRTGMRYAFRAAFRPPNLREDLAHVGEIVGSRALWGAVAIIVITAVVLIATTGADTVSRILAPYFLIPPPIAAVFIAGFFSRRASYVSGAIVAIVAAIALQAVLQLNPASLGLLPTPGASPSPSASPAASASALASAAPSASASPAASGSPAPSGSAPASSPNPSPSPSAQPITEEVVRAAEAQLTRDSFTTSPITSIFFASAAAWYRRFLRLGNPNRPPARGTARGKPTNRRR
jgi:hypothetical protein